MAPHHPDGVDAAAALRDLLFTNRADVNRFDAREVGARLWHVERLGGLSTAQERADISRRLERNLRSLAKVKRDLTAPTPFGGFNAARDLLLDREDFFRQALGTLRGAGGAGRLHEPLPRAA